MDLFTYLLAKNDKFSLVHKNDLFSYLLGKNNSIPLKTAEGVSITIEALKTKINELKMTKESTQDGTPTPDNPIPVKVVEGYDNLFDKDNANILNGFIDTNNRIIAESPNSRTLWIKCNSNTSYTVLKKASARFRAATLSLATNPTYNDSLTNTVANDTATKLNITTGSNDNYLAVLYYNSTYDTLTEQEIFNSIMITEGTESHPYVPYGNNYVDVKVTGKNLFNPNAEIINQTGLNSDGTTFGSGVSSVYNYMRVKPNTTYTLSGGTNTTHTKRICMYSEENETSFVATESVKGTQITFTTTSTTNYIRIQFKTDELNSMQLEQGSVATPYEPYKELIVSIPLNGNFIGGKGNNLDELIVDKFGKCYLNKVITKIDSYNGETITTEYMSTTGGLDIGATIYYVTPSQLIDLNYTIDLKLFKGENNISNSEDMMMTLKYY